MANLPPHYTLEALQKKDADLAAAFHAKGIALLSEEEKTFLLFKPRTWFQSHFQEAAGNGALGVFCRKELVGMGVVRHPTAQNPHTGMVDIELPAPPENLTLLQGVIVSPEHRGRGLMQAMVRHWFGYSAAHGRTHALAEIDIRNIASWKTFLNAGMRLSGIGTDPQDGTLVYNAQRELSRRSLKTVFNTKACPANDIDLQKSLFADGYACNGYDKGAAAMLFMR